MADTQEKKVCPCCTKHTMRSEEERKKLINRLKRVEGQIRGIIGMLENDAYCNDILIQSAAVNAAVNAFNKELLASHIRHLRFNRTKFFEPSNTLMCNFTAFVIKVRDRLRR